MPHACKLHADSSMSDDNVDYWRPDRPPLPAGKIKVHDTVRRVGVGCFRDHGRRVRQGQRRKTRSAAYTVSVPRR